MAGFDPLSPADSSIISAFPKNERDMRTAIQALFQKEHNNLDGIHEFGAGDDGQRGTYFPNPCPVGVFQIWAKVDEAGYVNELQFRADGDTNWKGVRTELTARDNYWPLSQASDWKDESGQAPTVTLDFNDGNFFYFEASADFAMADPVLPTRPTGDPAGIYILQIKQQTAGDHVISSFGTGFAFPTGIPPTVLTPGVDSVDFLQMIVRQDGLVHVEVALDSRDV